MKKRIFYDMCLLSLATILLSTLLILGVCYQLIQTQMQKQIENEGLQIASGLNYATNIDSYLTSLTFADDTTRVTVINPDGTVYFDNKADSSKMDNHLARPEIAEAMRTGHSQSVRFSATLGEKTFYYAILLKNLQVVRVAATTQSVLSLLLSILPAIILMAMAVGIIALLFATGMTKRIVTPINSIDLDHPAESVTYDELSLFLHRILQQKHQINQHIAVLRAQKDEFGAITENMQEGLIVLDKNLTILSVNNSASALFLNTSHCEGGNFLVLTRNLSIHQLVKSTLLEGVGHNGIIELNGRSYQFLVNPVFHGTESREIKGIILIILDITEKQEAEKVRREFSANVSHELKTPLTSISGYAELIEREMVEARDIPTFAQKIHGEASRLLSLIEDIIKLSELDEAGPGTDFIKVDLLALSQSVAERLAPQAEEKQVQFIIEGEPLYVQGNPRMLDELVFNLCDNAVRYNKEKGQVRIRLQMSPQGPQLKVEDTGIGIPTSHQNRIFERFYRVDKSHSKQTGGTGLGLSIVKHVAHYHHATLSLKSAIGVGTTILVTFPKD